MTRRRVGQLDWVDAAVSQRKGQRRDNLLAVSRLVDWAPFDRVLSVVYASKRGEASYPPLVMFKVLLLQRWYTLSDPAMEEALSDRLSFRRFAGLSLTDETPDHTTIWRFRGELERLGLDEKLFAELSRQLDGHGVILRKGTLIDASLVASAARRPRMDEEKESPLDPEARFGTNNERQRYVFGYKMHVAVDAGAHLVRAVELTPANVQEVTRAGALVQGDEMAVFADRAYDAGWLHDQLATQGIADGIMRRGPRDPQLAAETTARNKQLSLRRRPVEAFYGTLKRCYGFSRMRYFTMARNRVALTVACMAFNLRRLAVLSTP